MAANDRRLIEQLQAFMQRWQNALLHPVQAMHGGRVEALFFPGRHQRFLDSNSEIALNPAAPQREERSSGHGGLQENWARPGSSYGLRQESAIGPEFSPLRDEAKRGVTAESAGGLRQEPTNARLGLRDQSATLDTIEALQHRVQQLTTPEQSRSQARHRDQGMGL
jgi:hypothetical protein